MPKLSIATINTGLADFAKDLKTWKDRACTLSRRIEELEVDIVVFQEIWQINWAEADAPFRSYLNSVGISGDYRKDELLIQNLGHDFELRSSVIKSVDRGKTQAGLYWGLAIASRFPLQQVEHQELSYTSFDRWPRIAQRSLVALTETDRVCVGNIHLPAESHEARLRTSLESFDYFSRAICNKRVIAGDLNSTQKEGALQVFLTRFSDAWMTGKETDVLFGNSRATAASPLHRLASDGRIDYILTENIRGVRSATYDYRDGEDGQSMSDHPLVVAHFEGE